MTTATKTAPATVSRYGFTPACLPVTRERQATVDSINQRAADLDEREAELQADREQIIQDAMTTPLGNLLDEAERLKIEKTTLEADRVRLMWDRHAELPLHEPSYLSAIAAAEQAVEAAIEKQLADFAKKGIDEFSLPSGQHAAADPAGTRALLRKKAAQEPAVLAAIGAMNRAKANLAVLRSQFAIVPTTRNTGVQWRPAPAGVPSFILTLFN